MLTFGMSLQLPQAPIEHPAPGREPGSAVSKRSRPPKPIRRFGERNLYPRRAERRGAFQAGRAAADDQHGCLARRRASNRSGCQPRRHSSPAVGFWVQRTGTPSCQLEMQMLQPMHSRISCSRPSSDLSRQERVGDRGPGAADQIENAAPDLRDHGIGGGESADAHHRLSSAA